jgi:pyridoxine/pyridoxamine 5'-phosphate oxidase
MQLQELLSQLRKSRLAVLATVSPESKPESALVGFAVSDSFELIFDTLETTRKSNNLRLNPQIALVIGWDDYTTVQYEGIADEPAGAELENLKEIYFQVFPDGPLRQTWPGISYFRVRPNWIRYSCYNDPVRIVEFRAEDLVRSKII